MKNERTPIGPPPTTGSGVQPPSWIPNPGPTVQPPAWQSAPIGCICPPAANLSCQRPDCPRKPLPKDAR